jgi:hypothetical protein
MAETAETVAAAPTDDENDEPQESTTDLLGQLARHLSVLAVYEARLAASRRKADVRRAALAIAAVLGVALAFLTAFVFANVAAVHALSEVLSDWAAALVLAVAWTAVGALVALFVRARAIRVTGGPVSDTEEARANAEAAVRSTIERLSPALAREIALAAVPMAAGMASGVVDAGEEIVENVDDMVEAIVEDVPGGGVVNQIWDVVLMPGRFGLRVATTVLRRGEPGDET